VNGQCTNNKRLFVYTPISRATENDLVLVVEEAFYIIPRALSAYGSTLSAADCRLGTHNNRRSANLSQALKVHLLGNILFCAAAAHS
jgi:hypothetical protein